MSSPLFLYSLNVTAWCVRYMAKVENGLFPITGWISIQTMCKSNRQLN